MTAAIAVKVGLKSLNCIVEVADTGLGALEKIQSNNYDLIFMDIGLPDIDGLEVTKKIRALQDVKKANTPIVALTGHMHKRGACLTAGMQNLLIKPLIRSQILQYPWFEVHR